SIGGLSLYTTEFVLGLLLVLDPHFHRRVTWDRLAKVVVLFVFLAVLWLIYGGIDLAGAGPKAFSFFVYSLFFFIIRAAATTEDDRWRILAIFAWTSI